MILTFVFFFIDAALSSILEEVLKKYDYSSPATFAGLIGWLGYLTGFIGSLFFALLARKASKLKCLIILTCMITTASLAAFTFLIQYKSKWLIGGTYCLYQFAGIAICPLILEMGV